MPSSVKQAAAPLCTIYGTPLNLVVWRRSHILFSLPSASAVGTTVQPQRVPVKPAILEKEQNSIAQVFAPSIS